MPYQRPKQRHWTIACPSEAFIPVLHQAEPLCKSLWLWLQANCACQRCDLVARFRQSRLHVLAASRP